MLIAYLLGVLFGGVGIYLWQNLKLDPTDYALCIELNFPDDTDNTKIKAYLQRKGIPCQHIIDSGERQKTIIGHFGDYRVNELFGRSIHLSSVTRLRGAVALEDD